MKALAGRDLEHAAWSHFAPAGEALSKWIPEIANQPFVAATRLQLASSETDQLQAREADKATSMLPYEARHALHEPRAEAMGPRDTQSDALAAGVSLSAKKSLELPSKALKFTFESGQIHAMRRAGEVLDPNLRRVRNTRQSGLNQVDESILRGLEQLFTTPHGLHASAQFLIGCCKATPVALSQHLQHGDHAMRAVLGLVASTQAFSPTLPRQEAHIDREIEQMDKTRRILFDPDTRASSEFAKSASPELFASPAAQFVLTELARDWERILIDLLRPA
jgi:hypothetical protein